MKPSFAALLLVSLTGVTAAIATAQTAAAPPPPGDHPHESTLTVSGHGEAEGAPDRAVVRLGDEVQGIDAVSAQNALNLNIGKVLDAVQALGIDPKRIQTTGLSIYTVYANNNSTPMSSGEPQAPKIVGYRASETLQVTIDDLSKLGKAVDAGITAGANQMQGISFELQNDLPERTTALTQAATDARAKANVLAAALGVHIVDIAEIIEGGVNTIAPGPQPMYAMRSAAMAPTQISTGELRVQATVTVRYRVAAGVAGANIAF